MPLLVLALSLQLVPPTPTQRPDLVHSGWQMPGSPLIDDLSLSLREIGSSLLISGGLLMLGQIGRLAPPESSGTAIRLEIGLASVAPFLSSWAVWTIEDTWRGRTTYLPALFTSVGLRVLVMGVAVAGFLQTTPTGTVAEFLNSDWLWGGLALGAITGAFGESVAVRLASTGRVPVNVPLARVAF